MHWNRISVEEKLWVKDTVIQLIASGTDPVMKEELCVKDAISRIVVELIKREWPQQWPSLMKELHTLCCMGDEQIELVLLIFSRLADDVVQFQNVAGERKKEIYKTLVSHLNELFSFFWKTLSEKSERYFSNKQVGIVNEETLKYGRIAQVTLETLCCFVEWVPVQHITENRQLLKVLIKLLEFEDLRMPAVTCILNILERKGKAEEKKELLVFFEEPAFFNVISTLDVFGEHHFLFLKELGQCFLALAVILCSSMAQFSVEEPQSFSIYLENIVWFTKHPSMVHSHIAQTVWLNIFRSSHLSSSPSVCNLLPSLLKYETEKLFKVGFPSKSDSLSCKFSIIEFDSDEEFEVGFYRFKSDVGDVIKHITKMQPQMAFSFCCTLFKTLIAGKNWAGILDHTFSNLPPVLLWEAITSLMDSICVVLLKKGYTVESATDEKQLIADGLELLVLFLNFTCEDAVILSHSLSCTSSLFFFTEQVPSLTTKVLDKIFFCLTCFTLNAPHVKDVLNLRRHASSLLIRLSCNHPKLLLVEFDYLCNRIQELLNSVYLTQFDKSALLESLMVISNEFYDYEKQSNFLKAALASIDLIWISPPIVEALESTEKFVSFLGLNKPYQELNDSGPIHKNASDLMLTINVVKACAKRCVCPSDPEVAKRGNFIHPISDSFGSLFYQNPSAQFIIPALDRVIQLLRILNELHDPSQQQKFDPSFCNVLDICDADKIMLLGISYSVSTRQQKTPGDRIKMYLHNLHEQCLQILGASVENLGIDFYRIPNLSTLLKGSILNKIGFAPPLKLRSLIRVFLRPFFLSCPSTAYDELMIVLAGLCPFMLQKLQLVWEKFKLRYGTSVGYEDQQTEVQEILEDQLNRLLTREYISFLVELLSKQKSCSLKEEAIEDDYKEPLPNQSKTLTELGLKIIQTESVRAVFICTAFDSLRWLDTTTNIKAVQLCELLFSKIIEDNLVQQIQEANYLLQSVLYGIQELGEHEANLSLMLSFGLNVYESLRNCFSDIRDTLMSSVACDDRCIRKLDEMIWRNSPKAKNDKMKRDAFKNVIAKIIGRNIGQHHKRNVVIKNLPPLISFKPKENSSLLDYDINADIGICNLFEPKDGND